MSTNRLSENTFFNIANTMAMEATCPRRSVGCVVVNEYDGIVAAGYNGAPEGLSTCEENGCILEGRHCVRAVHAEIRAISSAAQRGVSLKDCRVYVTLLPCIQCMQALLLSGIRVIIYDATYEREEKVHLFLLAKAAGVVLIERKKS